MSLRQQGLLHLHSLEVLPAEGGGSQTDVSLASSQMEAIKDMLLAAQAGSSCKSIVIEGIKAVTREESSHDPAKTYFLLCNGPLYS